MSKKETFHGLCHDSQIPTAVLCSTVVEFKASYSSIFGLYTTFSLLVFIVRFFGYLCNGNPLVSFILPLWINCWFSKSLSHEDQTERKFMFLKIFSKVQVFL